MPQIMPTKEQRKVATEFGYNKGVEYRKRLIAWIKKLFGGKE